MDSTGPAPYVIMINGGYGVGKSAALDHVGDLLAAAARPFALMDVDWFHRSWPTAADDPRNVTTEAANLAAVWKNYQQQGQRQLVVSGVIAELADQRRYEDAFGLLVRSIRLTASPDVVEIRLRRRYTDHQQGSLDWHLERYAAIAQRLTTADLDEIVIDTDDLMPHAVAVRILNHFDLRGRIERGQPPN